MKKIRPLQILAGGVAVLLLLAVLTDIHGRRWAMHGQKPGTRLLTGFDTARIDRIELASNGGSLVIRKTGAGWVICNRWNYPASSTIVDDFLHRFRDAKVMRRENVPSEYRAGLCLEMPAPGRDGAGVLVRVYKGDSRPVAEMLWGIPVADPLAAMLPDNPQGTMAARYVMIPGSRSGKDLVVLAADPFDIFTLHPGTWMDHGLWKLSQLKSIRLIRGGQIEWQIAKATPDQPYEMMPMRKDEQLDFDALARLGPVLSLASFTDVADPALNDAATGLDHPVICEIEDFGGRKVAYHFGKRTGDAGNGSVYARIVRDSTVGGEVSTEQLKRWIFFFDPKIVDTLTGRRDQFLKKTTPEPVKTR
jgi:hypothetical protein